MQRLEWCQRAILTGFFGGLSPFMPGTIGTLSVVLLVACWPRQEWVLTLFLFSTVGGFLTVRHAAKAFGRKDPEQVVIDEWAGMALSLLFLPLDAAHLGVAFLFFRLFDIFKPFGIRKLDRLEQPAGIMWDDLLAGLYANLTTRAAFLVWTWFKAGLNSV